MDIVKILRDLSRLRVLLGVLAFLALFAAIAVTHRISLPGKLESRRYHVGVATARILVDTPSSQVVAVAPKGSDTLGVRANLIASLMVDGVFKTAIAQQAGLRPDQLVGISHNDAVDGQAASPPPKPGANVLTTRVLPDIDGDQLPIIEIDAQAADAVRAAKLADAAVAGLRGYLDTQAAVEQVPNARRLRVSGLGAAQARDVIHGPSNAVGFGVAIFVLVAGCGLILGGLALVRAWRATPEDDQTGAANSHAVATLARTTRADAGRSRAERAAPARPKRTDASRSFADDDEQANDDDSRPRARSRQ